MYKTIDLFDLERTIASPLLKKHEYPWEALADLKEFIIETGKKLNKEEYTEVRDNVWISNTAEVFETAYIAAPCIIDHNSEIRHSAFIRGSVIVGKNCVVGNSTELKNVILSDFVQVPHYNYVGDSVLGYKSHMGAGSITSNVKNDKSLVVIKDCEEKVETKRKKVGAMIGNFSEVGCNSVLNPGTVIGVNCSVYPLSNVRGVIHHDSIYKCKNEIVIKR